MSDANDQESQLSSAIDGLNRLTEGKLLQFIQSLTAMLEEANARQRALESADTPTHNRGPTLSRVLARSLTPMPPKPSSVRTTKPSCRRHNILTLLLLIIWLCLYKTS